MEYAPAVRTARTTRPTVVKCTSRNPSAICWELYSPAAWAATIAASRSLRPANFASGSRRGGLLMDGVSVRIPGMQLFRLDPLSCYLHDCSDCYQPERNGPGGIRTRRKSADFARRTSNSGRLEWLQCKLASNTGFAITQAPGNSLDGSEVRSSAFAASQMLGVMGLLCDRNQSQRTQAWPHSIPVNPLRTTPAPLAIRRCSSQRSA